MRRGGSLQDDDHRLLAVWAADCAQHVLHHFEQARSGTTVRDERSTWAERGRVARSRGERPETAAFAANAAARDLPGAATCRYAAGQAAAVGHVAAHELGAAAYAIRAARAASPEGVIRRWPPGVPVAACPASRPDHGPRARRPAAAQRVVLVRFRLPTGSRGSRRRGGQVQCEVRRSLSRSGTPRRTSSRAYWSTAPDRRRSARPVARATPVLVSMSLVRTSLHRCSRRSWSFPNRPG